MTDRCKRVLGWALCPSSLSCGGGSHSLLNRWPLNWSCGWLLLEPPRTLASSSASTTSRHLFSPLTDSPCRQLSRATPRLLPCDSLSGNGHTLQLRGPLGHPGHLDTSEEPAHITNQRRSVMAGLRQSRLGVSEDQIEVAQSYHQDHGWKGVLAVSSPADSVALFLGDGCSDHVGRGADGRPVASDVCAEG